MQAKYLLDDYQAELAEIESTLSDIVAPNALAEPRRIAAQCHDALARHTAPDLVEELFKKLRDAVNAVPPFAKRAPLRNDRRYVPHHELETVVRHVCSRSSDGSAPRPVWVHGAPGIGKSSLVCALHDRYHSVRFCVRAW